MESQKLQVYTPTRDMMMVTWSTAHRLNDAQLHALSCLDVIPGVKREEYALRVPLNAIDLSSVLYQLESFGVDNSSVGRARKEIHDDVQLSSLWQPDRPSFGYQAEEALNIVRYRRRLVSFDMGLGKTQTAIQAAETVRQKYDRRPVVIIGPLFARATWRRELYQLGAIESFNEMCCVNSTNTAHASWNPEAKYIFCHYDVLSSWWGKINFRRPCFSVIDEGHRIKNARTKRGKAGMMVAGTTPYCALLTATPMENRPSELWHLLSILTNPTAFGSPLDFRKRYAGAVYNGYGYQDTIPTHVEELRQRLETIYTRKTAEDVNLNLPPLSRRFTEVDPAGPLTAHLNMTDHEMQQLVQAVKENRVSSQVLPLLTALRKEASERKLATTLELAESSLEQGEKIVIFTWQKSQAKKIADKLGKSFKVHLVTGDSNEAQRSSMVDKFQAGEGDAIVATLGALREGVTLHAARIVILHDLDWVPAAMRQAEKRVLRIGQARPCIAYWMMCSQSVDMIFAALLASKLNSIEQTLSEKVDGFEGLTDIVARESDTRWNQAMADWRSW